MAGVAETAASPRPPEKAAAGGRWRIPFPPLLQSLACAVCGGASSVHRARARESAWWLPPWGKERTPARIHSGPAWLGRWAYFRALWPICLFFFFFLELDDRMRIFFCVRARQRAGREH